MTDRSTVQSTFTLERTYPVSPARVFHAWTDLGAKQRWFGGPGESGTEHTLDARVGGREALRTTLPDGGGEVRFDAIYFDVVQDERLIYSYDMHMGGKRISVSLAVVELQPDGDGTRLVVTEHGAYLDGLDTPQSREEGTAFLLDQLGTSLPEREAASAS